jgi:hypothetical protein
MGFRDWILSWRGVRTFATFALDDMKPFLRANKFGMKYLNFPRYLLAHRKESDKTAHAPA